MIFPITDLLAFGAYAVGMSITPGPNNAMLATLGAQAGWRRAMPAMGGVMVGFTAIMFAAGLGLEKVLKAAPSLQPILGWLGVAYMAHLAFKLWKAGEQPPGEGRPPVGFWGAIALQAVNPKAMVMALTAGNTFLVPGQGWVGALTLALLYELVGAPCMALWVFGGDRLRGWLQAPQNQRLFMRGMAVMLGGTALAMLP